VSSGTVYTGLMSFQGNVDLQKLLGWQGASFSTQWYWLKRSRYLCRACG
jgi:hypothetical protein